MFPISNIEEDTNFMAIIEEIVAYLWRNRYVTCQKKVSFEHIGKDGDSDRYLHYYKCLKQLNGKWGLQGKDK